MKKLVLLITLTMLLVTLASCSIEGTNTGIWGSKKALTDEEIADKTFSEIMNAIKEKDDSKIVDLFTDPIKDDDNLSQSASKLVEYIRGDIVSFSSASEAEIGVDYKSENGRKTKEIQSSFTLNTTETTYYVAIKERIKDESNNTGLLSIYIIESTNWTGDYIYRGDGNWVQGINIDESSEIN